MVNFSKKNWFLLLFICAIMSCVTLTSCGDDDKDEPSNGKSIVGKWKNGNGNDVLTFSKDGSYREDSSMGQYRIGTYSYNPYTLLLVIDIKAISGMNGAYQQAFIVQTLTSTTLVLMYPDGDVKGYYMRQ